MRFQPSHAVLCHMPQVCSGCWSFLCMCVSYRVKPKATLTHRCCQKRGGIYQPSPPRQWWHSERGTDPHRHCSRTVDTGGNTTLQKLVSLLDTIPAKHFPIPHTPWAALIALRPSSRTVCRATLRCPTAGQSKGKIGCSAVTAALFHVKYRKKPASPANTQ